ncbi:MAG: transposase [Spirochaetes bacterium]|nr:transposase [Spirochaetota bacterium]
MKKKSSPRLRDYSYKGHNLYFITINTNQNENYFLDHSHVEFIKNELKAISNKLFFNIKVFCIMPDHLHFLSEGISEQADLHKFIKLFKQVTSYCFKQNTGKMLWQLSYYDHILRKEENIKSVMKYILDNPVRKRLVNDWQEYPYSGSFEIDNKKQLAEFLQ